MNHNLEGETYIAELKKKRKKKKIKVLTEKKIHS